MSRVNAWKPVIAVAAIIVALLASGTLTAQSRPQDVELQAAIRTATVTGDLKAAIQQFKAIVAKYPSDRATTGKALLELADCYRRLGDAAAQGVLQQIVRDYRDQPAIFDAARARLAPAEPEAASNPSRAWTVPEEGNVAGPVSYDGRYVAFVDWSDAGKGDLFIHTLGTGVNRRLTDTGNQGSRWQRFPQDAAFSRDGRQIAYSWSDQQTGRYQVRVASLAGTAAAPRVLVDFEDPSWIDPRDWTPDGLWIAAIWQIKDGPREIGLVSTKDGSLRSLKSINRPCACSLTMSFSPDGKYLAFDLPGADTKTRDIFVLTLADAAEIPAVVYANNDELVGWAPDGQALIFTSDRSRPGTDGLWMMPWANGKPGTARSVRSELGPFDAHGVTSTGAIYFCRCEPQGGSDIKIASFDFSNGQFTSPPADAVQQFVGSNLQPFWSPDGKSFVYRSQRPNQDPMLVIQDVASGDTRELRPKLAQFLSPRWTPDGRSMAVIGRDFNASFGWHAIDAQTGRSSPLIIYPPGSSLWEVSPETSWSPDSKTLYFRREVRGVEFLFVALDTASLEEHVFLRLPGQNAFPAGLSRDQRTLYYQKPVAGGDSGGAIAFISRDLASGTERELARRAGLGMRNDMIRLSPDGRSIATVVDRAAGKAAAVVTLPSAGGAAREVFRTDAVEALSVALWAPDGGSLVVRTPANNEKSSDFWWVPLDGRPARQLTEFAGLLPKGLFLHPDGKRILFGAASVTTEAPKPTEFWVLENVIRK